MAIDGTPADNILAAASRLRGNQFSEELRLAIVNLTDQDSLAMTRLQVAVRLDEVDSPAGTGFLAVWLGGGVENGFDPQPTTVPILNAMLRWTRTIATPDDTSVETPVEVDEQVAIGLERLGQGLVAHLSRSPGQLAQLASREDIVTELERVEHLSPGVVWVLELLRKRSGTLLVIHVAGRVGYRLAYENLSNCFHLFTLLQAALVGKVPDAMPVSEQTLAIASGEAYGEASDSAQWHYGRGDVSESNIAASVWGEASPESIPQIGETQVMLLWPNLLGSRAWDAGFFGPYLEAAPPRVNVIDQLTTEEVNDWWEKLKLPDIAPRPWWKLW